MMLRQNEPKFSETCRPRTTFLRSVLDALGVLSASLGRLRRLSLHLGLATAMLSTGLAGCTAGITNADSQCSFACTEGEICLDGTCATICEHDQDCGPTFVCDTTVFACVPGVKVDASINCNDPNAPDSDEDGIIDACDLSRKGFDCSQDPDNDEDQDGICAPMDLCPQDVNDPGGIQTGGDADGDGVCDSKDACMGFNDADDRDGDGIPDGCDKLSNGANCADDPLNDKIITDGGPTGDGDGKCAGAVGTDVCPRDNDIGPGGVDNGGDDDGDGVCDSDDVCPGYDDNGPDADNDELPDACDQLCPLDPGNDADGDGKCGGEHGSDACPYDHDIGPDGKDNGGDDDYDGVCDSNDKCQGFPDRLDNGKGALIDADGDGIIDGCDVHPDFPAESCANDADNDADGDGKCAGAAGTDLCPGTYDYTEPALAGTDFGGDRDGDGTCDDVDACPDDPFSPGPDLPETFGNSVDSNCDGVDGELAKGFFVSPTGSSGNSGETPAAALNSIQAAINKAVVSSTRKHVYVAAGTYPERIHLKDGVSLYGGYDSTGENPFAERLAANTTIIDSSLYSEATSYALKVIGYTTDGAIDGFTIVRGNVEGSDMSSIAVWLYDVQTADKTLSITNNVIIPGNAASGADGADGVQGLAPLAGDNGANGIAMNGCGVPSNDGLGGSGQHGSGNGGDGGLGVCNGAGLAGNDGELADLGAPEEWGKGGASTPAGDCFSGNRDGQAGNDGKDGTDATNPAAYTSGEETTARAGDLVATNVGFEDMTIDWSASDGVSASDGAHGGGGGGGGAGGGCVAGSYQETGGSGGGGGGGGPGGTGGQAGRGAGGSFGIVAWLAPSVYVADNTFALGTAGNGGNAGVGGAGQTGAVGGSGGAKDTGTSSGNGAPGGTGGNGGRGACGQGGTGGSAYAILTKDSAGLTTGTNVTNGTGTAGTAGSGGGAWGSPPNPTLCPGSQAGPSGAAGQRGLKLDI